MGYSSPNFAGLLSEKRPNLLLRPFAKLLFHLRLSAPRQECGGFGHSPRLVAQSHHSWAKCPEIVPSLDRLSQSEESDDTRNGNKRYRPGSKSARQS
jgi:hypothetical protein